MATSVKIDEELKGRIQHLAETRQRSAHWIMREAIREYVEREEARESFRQEALTSWKAYLTITGSSHSCPGSGYAGHIQYGSYDY